MQQKEHLVRAGPFVAPQPFLPSHSPCREKSARYINELTNTPSVSRNFFLYATHECPVLGPASIFKGGDMTVVGITISVSREDYMASRSSRPFVNSTPNLVNKVIVSMRTCITYYTDSCCNQCNPLQRKGFVQVGQKYPVVGGSLEKSSVYNRLDNSGLV